MLALASDVVTGGLKPGANWYGREIYGGEMWRWVNNDAEVVLGMCAAPGKGRSLRLTLEPGPGQGGQPARVASAVSVAAALASSVPGRKRTRKKL